MKYLIIVFLSSIVLMSCSTQNDHYSISGIVNGVDSGKVYLKKYDSDKWINYDSTNLVGGKFTFTGSITSPEMQQIVIKDPQFSLSLFVENSKIHVEIFPDSIDESVIEGSFTHDKYVDYLEMRSPLDKKMDEAYSNWKKARDAGDSAAMDRADSNYTSLENELKSLLQDYVKANPSIAVSPYLITRNSWQFELPELEDVVTLLDTSLNNSQYVQSLKKRVEILRTVQIGKTAPNFTMNDSTGTPITLSSLKGKILLVDFWASWCRPCREENPNVVKAYNQYSKKGFDILGCSFDKDYTKWVKAIKDDKLTWHHVSDLQGWGNVAGKLYGVNAIPANVLLDKDQKIIARNLRGDDLMKKLAELFGS